MSINSNIDTIVTWLSKDKMEENVSDDVDGKKYFKGLGFVFERKIFMIFVKSDLTWRRTIRTICEQFLALLKSAITLTGNRPKRVFIISIPDWGITPFASGRDRKEIANEIDAYNLVCEKYKDI